VQAPELSATAFGEPATVSMATQPDGQLLATLRGRIDARSLAAYVPEVFASRLTGATAWTAGVLTGRSGTELAIASDLDGLAIGLPAPVGKPAGETRALALAISRLGSGQEVASVTLAGGLHGRVSRAGERWQAALRFGAPLGNEPPRDGLWLYGELAALDVDAWKGIFAPVAQPGAAPKAEERMPGIELRGVDLKLARVRFLGRGFQDLTAKLERNGTTWQGTLAGPLIAGDVSWNAEGRGRVVARLERLAVPEPAPGAAAPPATGDPDLPALDVVSQRFDFRGRMLGRLELAAQPAGEEWRIDKLDIDAGYAKLASTGRWRRTGAGSLTTLAVKLDVANANALMAAFGYGEYLKRGSGHVEGTLAWPGAPAEFALASLSGSFKLEARNGQFAKIEPGAGKLLGLLSLQSLPRRALLDFRDVFTDGFAFERVQGDIGMAKGILLTDSFEISGPAAFVSLSGEVSLPEESQALTLRVVPEVGEGMALAATVLGTPVLGLSTLLVSKLLRNPLGKVVAYEYRVTGSWDNPVVTRTSAGAPAKAAASR
ncbi:MAG TPA: AsmA-like C-terminal region-containing protein, partial [Usitatibacter sp.]|nr:AsmA-like C-terminal region-containing protein [Usitatibacter sp.]